LVKSKNIPVGFNFFSIASCILSVKDCFADSVDLYFLNPFWASVNKPFLPIKGIILLYISFSKILENADSRDISL
jgi:hypothetical protein